MSEDTPIPIRPADDDERRREHFHEDMENMKKLHADKDPRSDIPLEHREDLCADDIDHFVVNFCLDHFNGKIDRLQMHVRHLRRYPVVAMQAIDEFLNGERHEPALRVMPAKLRRHFLLELRKAVQI